ncbi:metallophosphoesterase family protein (plasmid) [Aneurinibacillus sp. Ricciae_BoGa-3]|uniref:metallophosphoesterase family protein n=1 Tax=Aneurinibacillus sp. Ricciae_BoGa-3 TaxID=3022697 RepID=UPI00233F92E8|nr:metallophosphoesterase family protein [Aneurinibacillus sp. Ricciae_BoGa-3]WCK57479.1 metallophosphoesterase family protein [Aneurinibacillus sp. Ricciae_BoGa-3]
MNALVFADLHVVDYTTWQSFLNIDQTRFDTVWILGDIDIMFLISIKEHFSDKPIVGVHGNHDYLGDLEYCNIPNLHGKHVRVGNLQLVGVEGCVRYKRGKAPIHTQEETNLVLGELPFADVVLSHNSPKGIHDRGDLAHEGYEGLLTYMETKKPAYVLHGHQHKNIKSRYQQTEVIGMYGGVILNTETGETEIVLDLENY